MGITNVPLFHNSQTVCFSASVDPKVRPFLRLRIAERAFFRAWRGAVIKNRWRWKWALLALLVALVTASGDELHQRFTPGRTGAVSDVVLDMTGATFAQLVIVVFTARSRRRP
jgi:hypothetical protein